ncbi:putative Type 1 protein exporter [Septoria linicola]|nr:putative Type 1 protein exporter [Septoria linicola]
MADDMASTHYGITVLHYLAPIVTTAYFALAKTVAACLLQEPSKRAGTGSRRWPAIILQSTIATTVVAEGISTVLQAIQSPGWAASQDYIVYLVLLFALHGSIAVGIAENSAPLWHPYLGSWLVALAFEIPLFVLQATSESPRNGFSQLRMIFCILRASVLLALSLATAWFVLKDRKQGIRLDDETEALLAEQDRSNALHENELNGNANANGNGKRAKSSPTDSITTDEENSSEDTNNDAEFDSDFEDPDADKELKEQQMKRLKESGSWLSYLSDFKIFFWILLPRDNRVVQGCFVAIGLIILAERALVVLVPYYLGRITEELAQYAGTGIVPWSTIGTWMLLTAFQSSAGLQLAKSIVQMPVQQYGFKALSTTAFRHIMGLSMDFHNEKNSGELIRAIEQGTNLQDLIDFFLFEVIPMFFDLILAFWFVTHLFDIYMGLILVAIGFLYLWVGAKVTGWSIKRRRDYNTAWRNESKVQNEAINNWQTVSHFNRSTYESERYSDTVESYNLALWRYWIAYHCGAAAQSAILLAGRLAAVALAAYRVSQGSATVGSFITLVTYWRSIEFPLMNVSYSIRKVSSMVIDSERLLQLLTTKPTVVDKPEAKQIEVSSGEVCFEHVDFFYDKRKQTLKDVNFTVKPGQTVAFVGETGGGKSTILKLLYRYYDVNEGAIRIDGQDIRDVTLDSLRDAFGMVPQDPSLFNVSIMDNIRYARLDATDQDVKDACRAAAIHDKIESFPDGYKAMVGERGVKLSGGELQRVAIARAILRQPKIVLLDEATSMIDAETEAVIQSAFRRLTSGRTTFIVAHRLSTIQHADLILVIQDGKIVESGTHEELFEKKGKYVTLWSKQLSRSVKDVEAKLEAVKEDQALIELDSSKGKTTGPSGSSDDSNGNTK